MKHNFPNRAHRGFSLIEVLIAVVVLSLGLLALASLQSALIRSASDAKAQSLAMAIAKQKIEQLAAYQTLGGFDNGCVSPSAWVAGTTSCYRAITDEAAVAVDGNPGSTGTQDMGGINFTVATTVVRWIYNVSTNVYVSSGDTSLDSALVTSPDTLLPGKEFKRILVTVAWTDATGGARAIQVEDALNGIVPRDSVAVVNNRKGVNARTAESIIVNPGSVAGVIPIAVGNGSNTAASNPTPELLGAKNNSYVSETRFDVYTYIPLTQTTALAQSRVETSVVGCRCDTATASTVEKPLRPTYWNGTRYAFPTQANYIGLTGAAPTKNYPLAGPKALTGGELAQSDQCRVCCRDHHDPAGNDANGDPYSAVAKVSPRRGTHSHFLVDSSTGTRTAASTGPYSEVCRLIRVDGIFRVGPDLNNDYFALLDARNADESSFVPSTNVSDDYSDMVKKYLKARFSDNSVPSTFNDSSSPNPYSNTYVQGTRTLPGPITRTYDLNLPATQYLKLTADAKWLHSRGLYVDYLEPEARDKIIAAQATCSVGQDTNECVLPFLPFTSINLTELAEWKDVAVSPDPASTSQVISVLNNGFNTATGDATYTTAVNSGSANGTTISFTVDVNDAVVPGMAVSGSGVAPNARVVSINNQRDTIVVDLPNVASVSGNVKFQATPVRGVVTPGTSPASGNTSDATTIATTNNAAIALRYPMNPDETSLSDTQRFEINSGGSPPDPTAGTFDVTGFSGYTVDGSHPKIAWGTGNATPSTLNACNLVGSALPFICPATSGLGVGAGMSILIGDYNVGGNTKAHTLAWNACKIKSGSTYVAFTGVQTSTVQRPYVVNYKVASASTSGVAGSGVYAAVGTSPYTVANSPTGANQLATETTELFFQVIALPVAAVKDTITVSLVKETSPNDEISADLTCCLIKAKNPGPTYSLDSVTWKPNACPFN
jgi:prepilin-type N-terminal cleavage/methylation domain-containing protein